MAQKHISAMQNTPQARQAAEDNFTELYNGKLATDGDGSNVTVTIGTETKVDVNTDFASGSKLSKLWGKAKAWFAALKDHAFSNPSTTQATTTNTVPSDALLTKSSYAQVYRTLADLSASLTSSSTLSDICNAFTTNDTIAIFQPSMNSNLAPSGARSTVGVTIITCVTTNRITVEYTSNQGERWLCGYHKGSTTLYDWVKVMDNANASNPNLIINSNFAINQRGAIDYTCGNNSMKYTVDRWKGNTTSAANSVKVTPLAGGGVYLEVIGAGNFWQEFEQYSELWGKTVTYSVNIGGTVRSYTVTLPSSAPASNTNWTPGYVDNIRIRLAYFTGGYFRIMVDCNTTKNFYVYWAKLEIGSTPTAYVQPLLAEELPKCQRYYCVIDNIGLNGYSWATGYICVSIQYPQEMRVEPTLTMLNKVTLQTSGTNYTQTSATTSESYRSIKSAMLVLNNFSSAPTGYYSTKTKGSVIAFDAEIY